MPHLRRAPLEPPLRWRSTPPVTNSVTPPLTPLAGMFEIDRLKKQITTLTDEVVHLKRLLAEANGGGKALTAAERQRISRERRKQSAP